MTESKIEQLHRMRAQGKTQAEIATALGVSKMTVFNHVKKAKQQTG